MRRALIAVMVWLSASCGKWERRTAHVVLPAAPDLKAGAVVRYRGLPVGDVKAVRIVDSEVQVDLAIRRADVPLRAGDEVRVAVAERLRRARDSRRRVASLGPRHTATRWARISGRCSRRTIFDRSRNATGGGRCGGS